MLASTYGLAPAACMSPATGLGSTRQWLHCWARAEEAMLSAARLRHCMTNRLCHASAGCQARQHYGHCTTASSLVHVQSGLLLHAIEHTTPLRHAGVTPMAVGWNSLCNNAFCRL